MKLLIFVMVKEIPTITKIINFIIFVFVQKTGETIHAAYCVAKKRQLIYSCQKRTLRFHQLFFVLTTICNSPQLKIKK